MNGTITEAERRPVQFVRGLPAHEMTAAELDLIDVAYRAYCKRLGAGEAPDADAYCAQFPHVKSSLRKLLRVHFYMERKLAEEPEIKWPEAAQNFLEFRLVLELGRGTFGRVFLATEPKVGNRLVVVKLSMLGGSEAEILGRNPHPNIVPIYSVTEDPATGLTAFVMPYLGSATLCNLLDALGGIDRAEARARIILDVAGRVRFPLDPSAAPPAPESALVRGQFLDGVRSLGAKLADALAYLHGRGICHRDLKPSNVLLSPSGEPILLDFNLSADAHEPARLMGGTLPYMAPEQLRAMQSDAPADEPPVDARSDIFSFGVILYQLATGIHPFDRSRVKTSTAELCAHLLERQAEGAMSACQVNPRIEPGLSRLLDECLAVDPARRPQSAASIAKRLRGDLTPTGRLRRWTGRNPALVLAASLLFAILGLGVYAAAAFRTPAHVREASSGARLYREGRYPEAIAHFSTALNAQPRTPATLIARGQAYLRLGKHNQALEDFQAADKLSPGPQTKAGIGYCLNLMGQTAEAKSYYEEACKVKENWAEVLNNLAFCCMKANQKEEARKHLDRAIQLDGRMQAAFHNRALLSLKQARSRMKGTRANELNGESCRLIQDALADIKKAKECGATSCELASDAAFITALAIQVDPKWIAPTLENLADAVKLGCSAAIFEDPAFRAIADHATFKSLKKKAANHKAVPQRNSPLVNPVAEL
jgi:serine/threonine protein kinase